MRLADDCLLLVQQWLDTLQRPADLSDNDFATFVRYAMSFFLRSERLWRKDSQGCHKIVAEPSAELAILRAVLDELSKLSFFLSLDIIYLPTITFN